MSQASRTKKIRSYSAKRLHQLKTTNNHKNDSLSEVFQDQEPGPKSTNSQITRSNSSGNNKSEKMSKCDFVLWSDEENEDQPVCSTRLTDLENSDQSDYTITGSNSNLVDITDILKEQTLQHCPICCKKNTFGTHVFFIAHLKTCASKNKLSTKQLMMAIELHLKQVNERSALGLPVVQEKTTVRRPTAKKGPTDANLQLAMALSASLRESEMVDKIREAETLAEAGLEKEALLQYTKLEDFGFVAPSKPNTTNASSKNGNRYRNTPSTILFSRTQEERERIITEKVAIILIDSNTDADRRSEVEGSSSDVQSSSTTIITQGFSKNYKESLKDTVSDDIRGLADAEEQLAICKQGTTERAIKAAVDVKNVAEMTRKAADGGEKDILKLELSNESDLKSTFLKKHLDKYHTLWEKSRNQDELVEIENYYCKKLSAIISPCKLPTGSKLRHLSQVPCRPCSQQCKTMIEDSSLSELAAIFSQQESKPSAKIQPLLPKPSNPPKSTSLMLPDKSERVKLCMDWKCLVNRNTMSDVTIYAKDERSISAHKLVLHVRCPTILSECIKEYENGKHSEMIMWLEYDHESIIAFLEYLYSGELTGINRLNEKQRIDLKNLSARYGVLDVKSALNKLENREEISKNEISELRKINKLDQGEKNLHLLELDFKTQVLPSSSIGSPEMFVNSDASETDNDTHETSNRIKSSLRLPSPAHVSSKNSSVVKSNDLEIKCDNESAEQSGRSSLSRLDVEEILSRLCSPKRSPSRDSSPLKWNEFHIPIIPESEKRKSCSPLEKDKLKKQKMIDKNNCETDLNGKVFNQRETASSIKLIVVSDASNESTDSDVCLLDLSPPKPSENHDLSIKFNDSRKSSDQFDAGFSCNKVNNDIGTMSDDVEKSPYVSPVWDGFEDINYSHIDYSEPIVMENHAAILGSVQSPLAISPFHKTERERLNEPTFDSFDFDMSALDHVVGGTQPCRGSTSAVQNVTPQDVRKKLKHRSKSEDILTPLMKAARNVTPLADYSNMKTNELKRELDRYGLKPGLNRGKAKKLLRYIYDQLHPFEDDLQAENVAISREVTKSTETNSKSRESFDDCGEDSDGYSTLSSGVEHLEESSEEDDVNISSQNLNEANRSSRVCLDVGFRNLIKHDECLHQKILLYEPVWLESLKSSLKEQGIKCSMKQLIDYLDEKCITFRTLQIRNTSRKKKTNNIRTQATSTQ